MFEETERRILELERRIEGIIHALENAGICPECGGKLSKRNKYIKQPKGEETLGVEYSCRRCKYLHWEKNNAKLEGAKLEHNSEDLRRISINLPKNLDINKLWDYIVGLCDFIVEYADRIPVYEQMNGKWGYYCLTELPVNLALKHAMIFIKERKIPPSVDKENA